MNRTLTLACAALVAGGCSRSTSVGDAYLSTDMGNVRWGANYFPNVELTTHEGKTVRFFDDLVKDKTVVINFIYSSCPDSCPLETAKLAEVQAILGDRVGQDTFFYSISIDPERDTPEVLADYAHRFGAGPGWLFLTGCETDIALVRTMLGLYDADGETNLSDHTLSLLIGNQATGRWMKISPMENSYVLATEIGDWLHNWKQPRNSELDYANAPKLRNLARGESLFRTRCAACHSIGPAATKGHAIGPDLLGVTERRERAWLERWLTHPDEMLEERDPLVVELYEKFNHVPMPNMRLGDAEVGELLDFIDTETRRIRAARPTAPAVSAGEPSAPRACCQKGMTLTMGKVAPTPAVDPAAFEPPAPREPWKRLLALSPLSLASVALGVALALVTALLRWRSGTSPR